MSSSWPPNLSKLSVELELAMFHPRQKRGITHNRKTLLDTPLCSDDALQPLLNNALSSGKGFRTGESLVVRAPILFVWHNEKIVRTKDEVCLASDVLAFCPHNYVNSKKYALRRILAVLESSGNVIQVTFEDIYMPNSRPPENLLLAALPTDERERLDPFLHRVELRSGQPITDPGEPIEDLYFPYDAVTSTVQEMSDGTSIETGLMGIEGLAGVQVWLRQRTTVATTFVQVPGTAHHITAADFIREIRDRPSPLNDLIAAYVHAFLVLTSITAACNRLHPLDQRLCRWLCMTYNRARRTEFPMRHEFLAQMLGVHRPTLSTTASVLQRAGLITYRYGKLTILEPDGLAEGACEYYRLMEAQFEKIFDQPWRDDLGKQQLSLE